MGMDLGFSSSIVEIHGTRTWRISVGDTRLTALEDGDILHWPEYHLFVMDETTGHLMVDGSFGTFAHAWPSWGRAKGQSLAAFLLTLRFDYFMAKAARQPWSEVDVRASILSMRREVLDERRKGYFEAAPTREVWDDLKDLDFDMTEGELTRAVWESGPLYDRFFADGGPSFVRRDVTLARRFWNEVWEAFRDKVLKPMVERERALAIAA